MFRILGIAALASAAWSAVILLAYRRRPGQEGWDAWRWLALSTAGGIVAGIGLLLLA